MTPTAPFLAKDRRGASIASEVPDNARNRELAESMGKKPNYRADRIERERAKAAKKAKRMEAKAGKTGRQWPENTGEPDERPGGADAMPGSEETGEMPDKKAGSDAS